MIQLKLSQDAQNVVSGFSSRIRNKRAAKQQATGPAVTPVEKKDPFDDRSIGSQPAALFIPQERLSDDSDPFADTSIGLQPPGISIPSVRGSFISNTSQPKSKFSSLSQRFNDVSLGTQPELIRAPSGLSSSDNFEDKSIGQQPLGLLAPDDRSDLSQQSRVSKMGKPNPFFRRQSFNDVAPKPLSSVIDLIQKELLEIYADGAE